jgi:hypothetical protein
MNYLLNRFTESISLARNDRKLVLLLITSTIFYSSLDTTYLYKFCALMGWYMAILLKVSFEQIKIEFYYWILLIVVYQVALTYCVENFLAF